MGKRKTRRTPLVRSRPTQPIQKQFDCPFCNNSESCDVVMNLTQKTGRVTCRVCSESFQTIIHHLSDPIDVYSDWIDACEDANR